MRYSTLSEQEKLFLRRRATGLTQADAAKNCGVSERTYRAMERGEREVEALRGRPATRNLTPLEAAIIRRRRAGKRQDEIAGALGFSRWLINRMERGVYPVIAERIDLLYRDAIALLA